jgi:hypothetical protein
MAGTSVDEAQNYCLKRRKRDDTASAQKQREPLNRVSEYPRREEEETKVGVGERTAQIWRERGTKRGRGREGWIAMSFRSGLNFKRSGTKNTGGV